MQEFTAIAIDAAKTAGQVLKENQLKPMKIELKGEIDLVTSLDMESERIITTILKERFPDHNIVAEEGDNVELGSDYVWYIDPLDGTTNYAHQLPWYAISIGLFKNGKPLSGVVYNPANDEMFYAELGSGAYLNGKKIYVSERKDLLKCLLVTGFPYYIREKPERVLNIFENFLLSTQGVRRFGAAALDLAYVAAGRYDGFWEEGLKMWDTAAGVLVLMEAGGMATDYSGKEFSIHDNTIAASNRWIHRAMLDIINSGHK